MKNIGTYYFLGDEMPRSSVINRELNATPVAESGSCFMIQKPRQAWRDIKKAGNYAVELNLRPIGTKSLKRNTFEAAFKITDPAPLVHDKAIQVDVYGLLYDVASDPLPCKITWYDREKNRASVTIL